MPEVTNIFYRVIPEQFRGPDFAVRGNLVFKKDASGNLLHGAVGQLEDATELNVSGKNAARLFGSNSTFAGLSQIGNATSVAGAVAAVINLGICVVGFTHISRSLKQVERRLENIERSLESIEGMLGVVDQKINQLLHLNDLQLHALSDIGELIKSYKVAEVHGALETLQFRLQSSDKLQVDHDIRDSIRTLQAYRIWLSDRRSGSDIPLPVRAEMLRAEVLVTLAEARARCFTEDEAYAVSCLEQLLESTREVVRKAWAEVTEAHGVHALFSEGNENEEDWIDVLVWLKRVNQREAANELLKQMAMQYGDEGSEKEVDTVYVVEKKYSEASELLRSLKLDDAADEMRNDWWKKSSGEMVEVKLKVGYATAVKDIFDLFNRQHANDMYMEKISEALDMSMEAVRQIFDLDNITGEKDLDAMMEAMEREGEGLERGMEKTLKEAGKDWMRTIGLTDDKSERDSREADVASLLLCYRLGCNVQSSLAACAAMEVIGEPARQLLWAGEEPGSPAIVIEMREPMEAA